MLVNLDPDIYVTSFSGISYYSNVRWISKIELEQNFQSIKLDVHASANKCPPHLFCFKLCSTNKYNSCLKLSFGVVQRLSKVSNPYRSPRTLSRTKRWTYFQARQWSCPLKPLHSLCVCECVCFRDREDRQSQFLHSSELTQIMDPSNDLRL